MWFTQLTTSSNVLIIFDVADSAVVKRTDGPEETDDGEEAESERNRNDRPGVQFNAVLTKDPVAPEA